MDNKKRERERRNQAISRPARKTLYKATKKKEKDQVLSRSRPSERWRRRAAALFPGSRMSAGTRAAAARSGFALGLPVECSHNGRSAATTAAAAPRSGFVLGLPVECSHNGGGAAQRVCSRAPGGVQPQRPRLLSGSRRSAAIRLAAAPPSGFALGSPVGCSHNAQRVCPRLPAGAQPGGWRQFPSTPQHSLRIHETKQAHLLSLARPPADIKHREHARVPPGRVPPGSFDT